MTAFFVLLALVAGVLLWAILLYNGLVRMRNMVEEAWSGSGKEITWDATLEEAVFRAADEARSGECVLLSPATASFDLFANYKERGKAFQRTVREWVEGAS